MEWYVDDNRGCYGIGRQTEGCGMRVSTLLITTLERYVR